LLFQEELYNAIVANDVAQAYDKIEEGADVSRREECPLLFEESALYSCDNMSGSCLSYSCTVQIHAIINHSAEEKCLKPVRASQSLSKYHAERQ
jgi:hypothetical protein